MSEGWCTLESDPGVFTELLEQIGVRGVQVDEIYSLDPVTFKELEPIYGLIFLFKWRPDAQAASTSDQQIIMDSNHHSDLFFANQVINNACATQAILSILMNVSDKVDIGQELKTFKEFTKDFDPQLKGLAISNSEVIRAAHNSFAPSHQFVVDQSDKESSSDGVFHFISYVPFKGKVYELDGLKDGPIYIGDVADKDWVTVAAPAIEKRIEAYSASEIRFNLMAVVKDRVQALKNEIEQSSQVLPEGDMQINALKEELAREERKRSEWKVENIRRKHNYIPFAVELLKVLASKGVLKEMIEEAKQKRSTEHQST